MRKGTKGAQKKPKVSKKLNLTMKPMVKKVRIKGGNSKNTVYDEVDS